MNAVFSHRPVLRDQVVAWLTQNGGERYVDATVGGGGHAEALLAARPAIRVWAVDQDPEAVAAARERLRPYGERVQVVQGNFRHLAALVPAAFRPVDGVLFDLGVSQWQLERPERGFSYQHDAPLDMRMDPAGDRSAFQLVNMGSFEELTRVIREWGEERWAGRIAAFIVEARRREPIRTTGQLVDVIKAAVPAAARRTGGHPARRTFQALRIWVNQELEALEEGLDAARDLLAPGGRIAVLSFHSLEDRIVKVRLRQWQEAGWGTVLTRHPVVPEPAERAENPRSRSAKLRVFARRAESS
ncbi:MAG: 16S rRNA (cytosine(1402)-N(4))-methyltransferase RsmH [Actinomycetia bacterium]|nr:16S rRNA (cytosine(1402)-N(4))-methyltransferase RsmH [Actinomycetes bacterium]